MKKHISEMNDRELDMFVKTLADKPNIAYDPKDWKAMNGLLDKQFPQQPGGWNQKIIWTFLGLLGVAVGLIVAIWVSSKGNDQYAIIPDTRILTTSLAFEGLTNYETQNHEMPKLTQDHALPALANTSSIQEYKALAIVKKVEVYPIANQNKPALPTLLPDFPIHGAIHESQNEPPPSNGLNVNTPIKNPMGRRFSVGLSVAPEMSTVQLSQLQNPGRSINLNFEYFIHEKWSLNTGIIHSYKTYTGGAGYYQDYQPAPTGFQGDCWVIDIPFNIRYYAFNNNNSKWFISSGISSYFMMREEYELQYEPYGVNSYSRIEEYTGNRHYFNVVNLSMGYQRMLGRHLAIQAEPYFKVPVAGIGAEKLSLRSAGIFLGLNYYW